MKKSGMIVVLFAVVLAGCTLIQKEQPTDQPAQPTQQASQKAQPQSVITQMYIYQVILEGTQAQYAGEKVTIGCNDSLVKIPVDTNILEIDKYKGVWDVLSNLDKEDEGIINPWKGQKVSFQNYEIVDKTLIVRLAGDLVQGGVCDTPRLEETLKATYKLFGFDEVKLEVNGKSINEY